MRPGWKKSKGSRSERLEERLTRAIGERNGEKVRTLLDRLHRAGVHEGFAVDAAKQFLLRGN